MTQMVKNPLRVAESDTTGRLSTAQHKEKGAEVRLKKWLDFRYMLFQNKSIIKNPSRFKKNVMKSTRVGIILKFQPQMASPAALQKSH